MENIIKIAKLIKDKTADDDKPKQLVKKLVMKLPTNQRGNFSNLLMKLEKYMPTGAYNKFIREYTDSL